MIPFPKPDAPKRLGKAAWKKLRDRACERGVCVGCLEYVGPRRLSAHHILGRDLGGDDVAENLVPLCGDGTSGCHGTYENRETGWEKIADRIRREIEIDAHRVLYLVHKRGIDGARAFLDRYYPIKPRGGLPNAA